MGSFVFVRRMIYILPEVGAGQQPLYHSAEEKRDFAVKSGPIFGDRFVAKKSHFSRKETANKRSLKLQVFHEKVLHFARRMHASNCLLCLRKRPKLPTLLVHGRFKIRYRSKISEEERRKDFEVGGRLRSKSQDHAAQ